MSKHTNDGDSCAACELKLKDAHPDHADWFRSKVKPRHKDAHVSWTYRGRGDQNEAVAMGKSKLAFPLSGHNKEDDQGQPCAIAMDLFRLCSNGMASWEWKFFRDIAEEAKAEGYPLRWGGDFKTLGDADHFERVIEKG